MKILGFLKDSEDRTSEEKLAILSTGVGKEVIEGLRLLASLPLAVRGGPKEARKRNPSNASIPVCLCRKSQVVKC